MSGQGKVHPERRAFYKEAARRIIGADREARRNGWSQNTIGEIERALVAAYLDGCDREQRPNEEPEPRELTWMQIPPRSRDTLRNMTSGFSRRFGGTEGEPTQHIARFDQGGKVRWREVYADGGVTERSVADGSVSPLVRLGLLEPIKPGSDVFRLTDAGIRLALDYWKRSDQGDRTLPRLGVR